MTQIQSTREFLKDLSMAYIGEHTYGQPQVFWYGEKNVQLKIGKFCSIAEGVKIFLGGEHKTDWVTTYPFPLLWKEGQGISGHPKTKGDVIIGNDVWIAHSATILSGVTIGDGAVIGGGAVVTKDVPPYTIVAGNPARIVKQRFNDSIITDLLEIKWWNWEIDKIKKNIKYLCDDEVWFFVQEHKII